MATLEVLQMVEEGLLSSSPKGTLILFTIFYFIFWKVFSVFAILLESWFSLKKIMGSWKWKTPRFVHREEDRFPWELDWQSTSLWGFFPPNLLPFLLNYSSRVSCINDSVQEVFYCLHWDGFSFFEFLTKDC